MRDNLRYEASRIVTDDEQDASLNWVAGVIVIGWLAIFSAVGGAIYWMGVTSL